MCCKVQQIKYGVQHNSSSLKSHTDGRTEWCGRTECSQSQTSELFRTNPEFKFIDKRFVKRFFTNFGRANLSSSVLAVKSFRHGHNFSSNVHDNVNSTAALIPENLLQRGQPRDGKVQKLAWNLSTTQAEKTDSTSENCLPSFPG